MPLRDDLLEPIEGENPSGPNLQYDKIFDQIKEARTEEEDGEAKPKKGKAKAKGKNEAEAE